MYGTIDRKKTERGRRSRRRRKRKRKLVNVGLFLLIVFIFLLACWGIGRLRHDFLQADQPSVEEPSSQEQQTEEEPQSASEEETQAETEKKEETTEATTEETTEEDKVSDEEKLAYIEEHVGEIPSGLVELAGKNDQVIDFVYKYPELNGQKQEIDLSKDYKEGQIPHYAQFDLRWGYTEYGVDCVGLSGSAVTALAMVYTGLTGDLNQNPATIAQFAMDNGYYIKGQGTAWNLLLEGAKELGLSGKEFTESSISETMMKDQLAAGHPLIVKVSTGSYDRPGHMVVVRGYDEDKDGFIVDNPLQTSSEIWSYSDMEDSLKRVWSYSYEG